MPKKRFTKQNILNATFQKIQMLEPHLHTCFQISVDKEVSKFTLEAFT